MHLSQISKEEIIPIPNTPYLLTPYLSTDRHAMVNAFADPDVYANASRIPIPYTLADADEFLNNICKSSDQFCFALRHDKDYIGSVSIKKIIPDEAKEHEVEEGSWEVGYALAKEWRGKGLMVPVVRTLVEEVAFKRAGLKKIYGFARVGNWASRRIMEKVGFEFLGEIEHDVSKVNQPGVMIRVWKFIRHND
ncbi:uncharacterized protein VTP21DRAFT_9023 [Calcarisporiella thermophila]|uniref:uncharacterized protein n=1 Tax=Calcarisporiella thermophila TaxID=911321 RepID=UPI00374438D4